MKRNYFVFLLMLLAIFSLALPAYAKKIKFGEHIVYNGKVEGETPAGEGKLVITHPNNKKTESAICIGTFDGWIIQGSIEFYAKNALPSFTGKAELSVSEYGTSVIYKLIEGVYKDEMHADGIQITEKRPLLITSKIGADIELSSSEIVLTEQVSYAKYADFSPLNVRTITNSLGGGQEPKFYKHSTCQISVDKVLHEVKYHETADFGNDMTAIINGESISFTFKNGDYYIYKSKQITPISFKKHYTDCTISLTANEKVIRCEDNKRGAGMAEIPSTADGLETMLIAKTSKESKLRFFFGELATLFEKAQNGNQEAASQLKTKTTLIALEQAKVERRKSKVGKELMEIGIAYKNGDTQIGSLYDILVEKGAMTNVIPISKDSALVWTRMAADVDTTYKSNVKDLEIEMGIYVEEANQTSETSNDAGIHIGSNSNTIAEAKKLTKGGDYIDMAYKVTVPIGGIMNLRDNSTQSMIGLGVKATLEVVPFGQDGNTVLLSLNFNGKLPNVTYSWSGKNVHMGPGSEGGANMLMTVRGNTPCGGLAEVEGKWIAVVNTASDASTMSDIKKGMTRSEVQQTVRQLSLSQFKLSRKVGNLDVYTLYWLGEHDRYDFAKHKIVGVLKNDKRFGDFYFDSKGKLVKWIIVY